MKESTSSFPFSQIDVYNTCYALECVWMEAEEGCRERTMRLV